VQHGSVVASVVSVQHAKGEAGRKRMMQRKNEENRYESGDEYERKGKMTAPFASTGHAWNSPPQLSFGIKIYKFCDINGYTYDNHILLKRMENATQTMTAKHATVKSSPGE
jgi:hypothetical protein